MAPRLDQGAVFGLNGAITGTITAALLSAKLLDTTVLRGMLVRGALFWRSPCKLAACCASRYLALANSSIGPVKLPINWLTDRLR